MSRKMNLQSTELESNLTPYAKWTERFQSNLLEVETDILQSFSDNEKEITRNLDVTEVLIFDS